MSRVVLRMRLLALVATLLALGSYAASSGLRPDGATVSAKQKKRRLRAVKLCTAQGPRCKVVERPGQPRDLTGVACVCG